MYYSKSLNCTHSHPTVHAKAKLKGVGLGSDLTSHPSLDPITEDTNYVVLDLLILNLNEIVPEPYNVCRAYNFSETTHRASSSFQLSVASNVVFALVLFYYTF